MFGRFARSWFAWIVIALIIIGATVGFAAQATTGRLPTVSPGGIFPRSDTVFPVDYDDLVNHTEDYVGGTVMMAGQVFQVTPHWDGSSTFLVNVRHNGFSWVGPAMLECRCDVRPSEGDEISFVATVEGRQAHKTPFGVSTTIPRMTIDSYGLN